MLEQDLIREAARIIAAARLSRAKLGPLPDAFVPRTQDEAYAVQEAVHLQLSAGGFGRIVGRKIGCTTRVMRDYLHIDHPSAGAVFSSGIVEPGATLDARAFVRVGVECEIAALLAADLPAARAPYGATEVATAVGHYAAAIEIVDDRYDDWRSMGAFSLIADDFFAAGCVLGEWVSASSCPDLGKAAGRTFVNGEEVGAGRGADVMGHPQVALAWLANAMARSGSGLRAGDFVLTGSLVQTIWLDPGDRVEAVVEGLGAVRLGLEA